MRLHAIGICDPVGTERRAIAVDLEVLKHGVSAVSAVTASKVVTDLMPYTDAFLAAFRADRPRRFASVGIDHASHA